MGGNAGGRSSTSLAPGFRFHPTDEELVSYYLKRKVCGKPLRFDAISEIEIYKSEPWDLPGLSKLKTRDLEWYFFSNLDKKYGNGSKTNRATTEGYWKTTGKDRPVHHRSRIVGMKKTLVYHRGRAPRGERTNWVMHEYRLIDEGSEKAGNACMLLEQESFVLCRIFQKSGTGPKNGEKYGAPFVEEEWEDDSKVATLPIEPVADEFLISDDSFAEGNDLDQDPAFEFLLDYPTSLNPHHDGGGNIVENLAETEYNLPTMVNEGQVAMETNDDQKLFNLPTMENEGQVAVETNDDQKFFNLPVQLEADAVKSEYPAQPTDVMSHVPLTSASEHGFDNVNSAPSDEAYFLEANDLLEPIEGNTSEFKMLDEYITYFEADDDIGQYLTFDTPDILGADGALSDQALLTDQNLDQSNEQASTSNQQLPELHSAEIASTSKHVTVKSEPDSKYPFMKQASGMLGNFTGPSTFASEFPTKDMAARLHAAAQSSDPVRVTAGMIRITDHSSANEDVVQWSLDKSGNINVVLSFSLPEGLVSPAGVEALTDVISRKMTSAISRGWLCFFIFSVTLLCISAKVGASICAK